MSLFKFGDFEAEVDFTDADFLTDLEYAQEKLSEDARQGKQQNCLELSVSAILTFSIIFSGKERMKLCSKGEQVINYV